MLFAHSAQCMEASMGGPAFKELKVWGLRPRNRWLQRERMGNTEEKERRRGPGEPVSSPMKSQPLPGFSAKLQKEEEF